jgi:heme/copper-type cytochrome/quinol oxidase subunit 3
MSDVAIERVPKGRLGVWLLIAGELVIFGGFIACYALTRIENPQFGTEHAAGAMSLTFGVINTLILLVSNYTMVLAHEAAMEKNLGKMKSMMWATIILGLVFLGIKIGLEWMHDIHEGYTITAGGMAVYNFDIEPGSDEAISSLFWSYYYLMTGFHGLHIVVGALTIFFVMLSCSKGENLHRVELAGAYWHLVELVWVILFPLFYLIK